MFGRVRPLRTRTIQLLAGIAVLVTGIAAVSRPSAAQSLMQRLFGSGEEQGPASRDSGGAQAYGYGYTPWNNGGFQEDHNTYRTMCVRMCDGFYFPISSSVRRDRLYRDSRTCSQRCDGEARLFYYPNQGGSIKTMVDMGGRAYAELPNAFKYRKTLVSGCACKPAPWSPQEAARHAAYANEAVQGADGDVPDPIEERLRELEARRNAADPIGERLRAAAERPMDGEGPYYRPGYGPAPENLPDGVGAYQSEAPREPSQRGYMPWRRQPWGVGGEPAYGWR
jgi:hypothetical protein